ncbi:DUF3243 domain-containing protein [Ammoniphilus sp. CFH 90114]|uniref:DUF3243 domain-containing protein n=1 Tax=Ammoniphilus sp. CFH 90114 TaxID=2493665 RepID=UPI00100E342C|nr:DUF3243 domain-containing protein [Ammoniphilus sp. CFH 90114]RXT15346.1 DUF3243 domain-containing protein [Ammoniphilus sp. CFH 90114]
MSVLDNFNDWKSFLNERIDQAQNAGMNDATISNIAYQMADYLADKVEPRNDEERLLKELWESANPDQQKTLASVLVQYMDRKPNQ